MQHLKSLLLSLICASLVALSSCGPDDDLPPTNYPINDFIFNTFLFAEGSWWAFYDSTSGEFDTLTVTYTVGQYQNVYEGEDFQYSGFYYRGNWQRSKSGKTYLLEYSSDQVFDHNGNTISRIDVRTEGKYFDVLYYDNAILQDTMIGGYFLKQGRQISSYNLLLEKGDSLYSQNRFVVSPYVKYKILNSTTNELKDVTFVFQEHTGPIQHTMNGNYTLIDKHVIPMIK